MFVFPIVLVEYQYPNNMLHPIYNIFNYEGTDYLEAYIDLGSW